MPYPGIPDSLTPKVDSCINDIVKDPDFEPKDPKQSKRSAATAVCIARFQKIAKGQEFMKDTKITSFVKILGADKKIPAEIQVLPVGKWETHKYGTVEVTEKDITTMVNNFDKGIRAEVPIDVDHDEGEAAGWAEKLVDKGSEGLWAVIDWTTKGTGLLEERIYRFFSPEFHLSYEDPETSVYYGPTFIAGTLTNRPLFKELKPIVAKEGLTDSGSGMVLLFQKDKSMNLDDIKVKELKDLTEEEKKFLGDNTDKLSDEEKVKFEIKGDESTLEEVRTKEVDDLSDEDKTVLKDNADDLSDEEKEKFSDVLKTDGDGDGEGEGEGEGENKGKEKDKPVITAAEVTALKAKADAGHRAEQELIKMKTEKEVEGSLIFSEKGGKVAPKGKEDLVSLIMSLTPHQKQLFDKVMEAVPDKKIFGEAGAELGKTLTANEQFIKIVNEKIAEASKKGDTLEYGEAVKIVAKENPELEKAMSDDTPVLATSRSN